MSDPRFWDRFRNRLVYEAQLVAVTALRIGRGQESFEPTGSDLPVLRGVDATPFIPGSSVRGVLRAHLERMIRTLEPAAAPDRPWGGRGACDPLSKRDACVSSDKVKDWRKLLGSDDGQALAERVWEHSCRICRLFGSPFFASRVRIADLFPVDGEPVTATRDAVAINREKETVENKYDFEVVEPGASFALKVVADNLTHAELGLLFLGFRALEQGEVEIGGFKGRGLGRVTLKKPRLSWLDTGDSRALKQYLATGVMPRLNDPSQQTSVWVQALLDQLEEATA